jgi:hypothetical protein
MRTRHGPDVPDHHRLVQLLAAANAPARPGELAREEEAVAAFRAAHRRPVPPTQRQSMIKSALAKLLTVKVAALATAVAGVGGVALAASTGTLPGPADKAGPAASHSPAGEKAEKAKPSDRPSNRDSRPAVPDGVPPGLYWLCTEYIGRDAEHRGKALGESKFRELADRAGGQDREKADRFCDKLLNDADPPAGKPSSAPKATKSPGANKPSRVPDRPARGPSGDQPSTHPNR